MQGMVDKRARLRFLLTSLAPVALLGCSYTFDGTAPAVPLLGDPRPAALFPKLNDGPVRDVYYYSPGGDGGDWAIMPEIPTTPVLPPAMARESVRLVRIKEPTTAVLPRSTPAVQVYSATRTIISTRFLFLYEVGADGAENVLTVYSPGDDQPRTSFKLPTGEGTVLPAGGDAVILYYVAKPIAMNFTLLRTDGSYKREVPIPKGFGSAPSGGFSGQVLFDNKGDWFLVQAPDGQVTLYSTRAEMSRDLGVQPKLLAIDNTTQPRALISCSESAGVTRVPFDGSPTVVLDSQPCSPDLFRLTSTTALYLSPPAGVIREVPLSGSAPGRVALTSPEPNRPIGQVYLLRITDERRDIVYSLDPPLLYGAGIGDGWLDGWRFMERGRRPAFSNDGRRMRFLEHAARSDNTGDFLSVEIGGSEPVLLARNVQKWLEVAPGKLLTISNAAGRGAYNRLILIDENARSASWVIDSTRDFVRIPNSSQLLAKVVNGQLGFDIHLVPIPALAASQ